MANDHTTARVLIIQAQIKKYRAPFFAQLRAALAADGIALRVAYSDPSPSEAKKGDNQELPAEFGRKVKGIRIFGEKIFYQPLLGEILAADLVIVEQASKHLLNYLLLPLSIAGIKKVAYWGHGRNRQREGQSIAEYLKRQTLNSVDWWFAYTPGTERYLTENGVVPSKITNVQNAIDTSDLRRIWAEISPLELQVARQKLQISESAKIGLFCGGIFRERLPEFLIEAARRVKQSVPNFALIVVGGGPAQGIIEQAAREASYIHFLGPQFGRAKAVHFRLADAFLMPGPIGLAILDAFSTGLPVVTSSAPFHGPEIEYLEEGRNGVSTPLDLDAYSEAVARILSDDVLLRELKSGASASGEIYTLESMVERFHSGIVRCLSGPLKIVESERAFITPRQRRKLDEL